ncbi:amino acid ABC transporter permease [Streptococcus acidominimus]|uniref:Amino acid ABC transporter permease n=1 Tax=Streptococcus acidominimus TaxID=1326 RepID=A0A1Q8EDI3_STRAI|nr:amino acid ABC transporter permease [Streptococcus acidominimus]MBF0848291.1 amino acid ABC transporter permease [Streptococcus danieliae]MBF0817951.1 amino acid ABC transporter permease [Streptococcus acidominimus]MBF0839961.1 amino acid ABC transporter permease [Streptococcus acidominimus]OLF49866.1 amino acid ABC transporter permease [Streptococcus acidominimus]TFU31936.1 amino acid ABC transporter permease [Streptococcus acidominimus]
MNWQAIFNLELAKEAIPKILEGLPYTLGLSLIGFVLGTVSGFFVALLRMSRLSPLRYLAMIHISLMRGIPLMVLLFFIYFGLPFMGLELDAISASIIAFTLMSSAYISEIIRSSLSAIDHGQWEAARSLGLKTSVIYRRVIIPQAFRIAVPPLSNVLLDMVKSTSLTAMITVPELFNKAKIVGGAKSDYMTVYICVALIYWVICSLYALGQVHLEKRLATY